MMNKSSPGSLGSSGKIYDAADRPFDFVDDGRQTALVCMAARADEAAGSLTSMGLVVKQSANVEQALLSMRYHLFDVVVLDDKFDKFHGASEPDGAENSGRPGILDALCQLGMASRRKMFVALVTEKYRTMDRMAALELSVDLVVNRSSLGELGRILERAINEHEQFYAVFNDSLRRVGKA